MSTRNPTGWTAIHDTVRSAQDTLCRLWRGNLHHQSLEYREKALKAVAHVKDMSPPKSLGELCLEFYQDTLQHYAWASQATISWIKNETGGLRNVMYRRNTDPTPVSSDYVTISNFPGESSWDTTPRMEKENQ